MAKIAHFTSVESACSVAKPAQSAAYSARLTYLLSTRDLWPSDKLRERPEYPAILASANQHMQAFDSAALERECERFLDAEK